MLKRRLWKWFGYGSTLGLVVAAVSPGMFNIPGPLRPWVFLLSILWFFFLATGGFSS